MNATEYNEKLEKTIIHLEKVGIEREEVNMYAHDQLCQSRELGMSEEDAHKRTLASTTAYYRKYIDKLGNRMKFLCLGMSAPTDFGLKVKVGTIKKAYMTGTSATKDQLIMEKKVNKYGVPLHTAETTFFEDRIGLPINLEDEMTQNLFGIIEASDGKCHPTVIRVAGKTACMEKKEMYVWSLITGEQSKNKQYPEFLCFNTREPMMKPIKDATRIDLESYTAIVQSIFGGLIIDVGTEKDKIVKGTGLCVLKNVHFNKFSAGQYGTNSTIVAESDMFDITINPLADVIIPTVIPLDVDPDNSPGLWCFATIKPKKDTDRRPRLEILGMYVQNPVDVSQFTANHDEVLAEMGLAPELVDKSNNAAKDTDAFLDTISKV